MALHWPSVLTAKQAKHGNPRSVRHLRREEGRVGGTHFLVLLQHLSTLATDAAEHSAAGPWEHQGSQRFSGEGCGKPSIATSNAFKAQLMSAVRAATRYTLSRYRTMVWHPSQIQSPHMPTPAGHCVEGRTFLPCLASLACSSRSAAS